MGVAPQLIPQTPEFRFDAIAGRVEQFSENHGSPRLRAAYGDLHRILQDPEHHVTRLIQELAAYAIRSLPVDVANALPRELLVENEDADLEALDKPGSWMNLWQTLADPTKRAQYLVGCLMPTQSNYPGRERALAFASLSHGIPEPSMAEFGTGAGLLLKAAAEPSLFPPKPVQVGHPQHAGGQFQENFTHTEFVNRMLQGGHFRLRKGKGFDILPAVNPKELERIRRYTQYPEAQLEPAAMEELERLIDHPMPENVSLTNEDLTSHPVAFGSQHPEDLHQYDVVAIPTMLHQRPQPEQMRNILLNADLLRRPGGLIVVLDYVRFKYSRLPNGRRFPIRDRVEPYPDWPKYSYSLWVNDGKKDKVGASPQGVGMHFELMASFETGRADRWWLVPRIAKQLHKSPFVR